MKKKRIIYLCLILILIVLVFLFWPKNKTVEEDENRTILDWSDVIEVEVSGTPDDNYITITYVKEIPLLKEKIQAEYDKFMSEERNPETFEEDIQHLADIQNLENRFDFCYKKEKYKHLEKGDEFIIVCQDDLLDELGYSYKTEYAYKADEITEEYKQEIIDKTAEKIAEEQRIYQEKRAKDPVYNSHYDNTILYVDIYNIDNFELDSEKIKQYKNITLDVMFEEDLEKAIKFAKGNPNIDYVKYGDKLYSKETEYKEAEQWYGIPG